MCKKWPKLCNSGRFHWGSHQAVRSHRTSSSRCSASVRQPASPTTKAYPTRLREITRNVSRSMFWCRNNWLVPTFAVVQDRDQTFLLPCSNQIWCPSFSIFLILLDRHWLFLDPWSFTIYPTKILLVEIVRKGHCLIVRCDKSCETPMCSCFGSCTTVTYARFSTKYVYYVRSEISSILTKVNAKIYGN